MDRKFINLNYLYKLETLSHDNVKDRYLEELARFPIELDDAGLYKLGTELEAADNPLSDEALAGVDVASKRLQPTLRHQHARHKKLLAEKSYLMAETAKQSSIAKSIVKKIEDTKLNMKDRSALERLKSNAKTTVSRMSYNERLLTRWDSRARTISRRRNHLRKLMCCDSATAEKYENALGNKMMMAKRGYTHTRDYATEEKLREGSVSPHSQSEVFFTKGVHINNIATPIDEVEFVNDGGYLSGYLSLMEHLPEIIPMIRRGMSVEEILSDGDLREKAQNLVSLDSPIVVSRIGEERYPNEERYQIMDLETQRRVAIARLFDVGVVQAKIEAKVK